MPAADVIIHSGDISYNGTEEEIFDFLNWFIKLPYLHKIFVTGNHDLCLWDAEGIEDLPESIHFLQDSEVEIDGFKFFGLAYVDQGTQRTEKLSKTITFFKFPSFFYCLLLFRATKLQKVPRKSPRHDRKSDVGGETLKLVSCFS